jgi:flavodoxin
MEKKILVIVSSWHHNNTEKVARVLAGFLHAPIVTPEQVDPEKVRDYDLIGFGSGIDSAKHYKKLLDLADQLPMADNGKAFIFSTCGMPGSFAHGEQFRKQVAKNHGTLRKKLINKGFAIVDEFSCVGYNTNSFLKLFGGLNKGRPDAGDLERAADFAVSLLKKTCGK